MHMLSRKDLNPAELETVRASRSTTTVTTTNGEVQTKEEATAYVHDLELFVTVQILDDTPAVLLLGKLCEERGYSYEWASGKKSTADPKWENTSVQYGKFRAECCPRIGGRCQHQGTHPQTLLKIQIRNVLPKWYRGSAVIVLTSQKTEIAKSARAPRLQGLLAGSALAMQYLGPTISVP